MDSSTWVHIAMAVFALAALVWLVSNGGLPSPAEERHEQVIRQTFEAEYGG